MQKANIIGLPGNPLLHQSQGEQNKDTSDEAQNFIPKGFKTDLKIHKIGFITRNILITILFGFIYYVLVKWNGDVMALWKTMYFSLITQTTLGYDWLLPKKPIYYFVNAIHLILIWSMIVFEFVY